MPRLLFVIFGLLLAGCGVTANPTQQQEPSPTPMPLLEITTPLTGTVIYADTIEVSGTSPEANQPVTIELLGLDDTPMAQESTVSDTAGQWQISLRHNYSGDPIEALLRIVIKDSTALTGRTQIGLVLNTVESPPAEPEINVISPIALSSVGGDTFEVSGTAFGLPQDMFTVQLRDDMGQTIAENIITLAPENTTNLLPWKTELHTDGYTGSARITIVLDGSVAVEVPVEVSGAAG